MAETDGDVKEDPNTLSNQLDNAKFQLRMKETEKSKLSDRNAELESLLGRQKGEIKTLEQTKRKYKESADGLKAQNRILMEEKFKYEDTLKEAARLKQKVDNLKGVELAVKGFDGDLNQFLCERGAFDQKTRDIATMLVALKKKLAEVKKEKNGLEGRLRETTAKHERDKRKMADLENKFSDVQANNLSLENHLLRVQEELANLSKREERLEDRTLVIAEETENCSPDCSPTSLSPPSPARPAGKLPSFQLAGSVKRRLSSEEEERGPVLAVMNHTSSRLGQSDKKLKSSLQYDGMGGRSRFEEFPQPRGLFASSKSFKLNRTTKPQKTKLSSMTIQQNRTIDKFFGNFDTP